jgi:hypothetical protein
MSKYDRLDLTTVRRRCCIGTIHKRIALAARDDCLTCPAGHPLVYRDGRWRAG